MAPELSKAPSWNDKVFDLYISGKLFDQNVDKARHILSTIQNTKKYRVYLESGYRKESEYFDLLRKSKATFCYMPRWGGVNGRAVEAIYNGCFAIHQDTKEAKIFLSKHGGLIPFQDDNVLDVIVDTLETWTEDKYKIMLEQRKDQLKKFQIHEAISSYSYLLPVYASLIEKKQVRTGDKFPWARPLNRSPKRIHYSFDNNLELYPRLQEQFREALPKGSKYETIAALGESYLYSYLFEKENEVFPKNVELSNDSSNLALAISAYGRLASLYPTRIAALFNYGRLLFEQGNLSDALNCFKTITSGGSFVYQIGDLLFWRELQDEYFDYDCLRKLLPEFIQSEPPKTLSEIEKLIKASASVYMARISVEQNDLLEAETLLSKMWSTSCLNLIQYWRITLELFMRGVAIESMRKRIDVLVDEYAWIIGSLGEDQFVRLSVNSQRHQRLMDVYRLVERRIFRLADSNIQSPRLIKGVGKYNIVVFEKQYYGIPKSLGRVEFLEEGFDLKEGVIVDSALEEVLAEAIRLSRDPPSLIQEVGKYNIVVFDKQYYGIPKSLGRVEFLEEGFDLKEGVIVDSALEEVLKKIS
jgi:tetratricopeptide (TPR) repeat protein